GASLPSCAAVGRRIGQGCLEVNAAKCKPAMRAHSVGLEIHRYAIDAIAQSGGRGAVREDVAEMAAAAAAMALGADHAIGTVVRFFDRARFRIVEARPAGAALELFLRLEQFLTAARAGESAGALLVVQRAASRPLGAVLAHDLELLGRQDLA